MLRVLSVVLEGLSMNTTAVVGVDPGLVHTGVVRMTFDSTSRTVVVDETAVPGLDPTATAAWIHTQPVPSSQIFIEGYRTRSNFSTDQAMVAGVQELRQVLKGQVVLNTGVKQVVRRPLMELLGVWQFATVTHHQDLRSAARIALLGMLKSEQLNRVVTQVVLDHLAGRTWNVRH